MEVCSLTMPLVLAIVIAVAMAAVGFVAGIAYRKKVAEREITSAEEEAKRIVNEAIKSAESKKREALVEAKEEIHKNRSEYEREVKERRAELSKQERRLQQKEENLDRKIDAAEKKNETLSNKIAAVEAQQQEIATVKKSQLEMLEKISGFTIDEAKAYLIANVRDEVTHEMAVKVREVEAQFKEEADDRAREIIATAIQRCAADHASEITVSVVPLPNDEMKGRIIGREGRNIRSIETLTSRPSPAAISSSTTPPRPSRSPASTPSGVRSRASRLRSSSRTAASTPPASRKWSPRPRKRSTPPSRPRASAPCSRPTSTVCTRRS